MPIVSCHKLILLATLIKIVSAVMQLNFKCCSNGKVSLQPLLDFPDELRGLLSTATAQAKLFRRNIRIHNNVFSFASLSANIQEPPGNGPPCFRICGQLFHRYGALFPDENQVPNYSQLYTVEPATALNFRMQNPANHNFDPHVMEMIHNVLTIFSPYSAALRNMAEIEREEQERARLEKRPVSVDYARRS